MKENFFKKTAAFILALTILSGGLPQMTGGAPLLKPGITADAAGEVITPAVGKVIKWGERLELGELYLKDEYYYTKTGELIYNYLILGEPKYLDDKDMWSIGYVEGAALCAVKTDTDRHYEIPIGVKIVSGTGAYNDPFTMELVYSGDAVTPEEVTVGKKWYVGDTINTDAYFIGGRGLVFGESDAPTRISFDSNSCKFHLINKKLSSAYKLQDSVSEEDFLVFPDTVSTTYTDLGVDGDGYPTGLAFEITSGDIIGIEVTGGSGTKEDPFTLAPITGEKPVEKAAVLDEETGVLTLGGEITVEDVRAFADNAKVKKIVCEPGTVFPEDCSEMFCGFDDETDEYLAFSENLEAIDLSNADMSNVTDMSGMFSACVALKSIDLSGIDTSNVTNMNNMFDRCNALKSIDLSSIDTSSVTDMSYMFYNCAALASLDVTGLDTSNVTSMFKMFCGCRALTSLDVTGFNTSSVTNMYGMFSDCEALTSIDVSSFDTSKVTTMQNMFSECYALKSIDLSGFDTSSLTNSSYLFRGCTNLETVIVSDKWNMDKVTQGSNMFNKCTNLVGGNGTVYSDEHKDVEYARIDTDDTPGYFTGIPTAFLEADGTLTLSGKVIKADVQAFAENTAVKKIVCEPGTVFPVNCSEMFTNFAASEIDLSNADTSKVTNMSYMFSECASLTSIEFGRLNTENVTDMSYMFMGCKALTELNLKNLDTASVKDMSKMFYDCTELETIIVYNKWITSIKLESSADMFGNCKSLVGGNGTVYNSDKTDAEYAHVDTEESPGYLTKLDVTYYDFQINQGTYNSESDYPQFSYAPDTKTLTVLDDFTGGLAKGKFVTVPIINNQEGLILTNAKACTIKSNDGKEVGLVAKKNMTIAAKYDLSFPSGVMIMEGATIELDNCEISSPAGAHIVDGVGICVKGSDTELAKDVVISTTASDVIIPAVGVTIKFGEILKCVKDHDTRTPYYFTCDGEKTIYYEYDDDKAMIICSYLGADYVYSNTWSILFYPSDGALLSYDPLTGNNSIDSDGYFSPPAERHYEEPIGVKIVSGTGTESDPFKLELAYEGDPVPLETDVKVGKKWYIGDTISTDAFFSVITTDYNSMEHYYELVSDCKINLLGKKLPTCTDTSVYNYYTDKTTNGAHFSYITTADTNDIFFDVSADTILGIEITGGSGTEADPFTIAPIIVATDETTANKVIKAIDAIGTVEYTPSCKAKIVAARKAYDALTDAQKALVTNYATLTKAEADYAKLDTEGAAAKVDALISAIGTVELTDACKAKITAARAAYDALTDAQKALVTNYETLTKAEADYAALELAALGGEAVTTLISNINSIDTAIWGAEPDLEAVGKAITAAKTAYAALDKELQPKVTNYNTLLKDEKYYSALKSAADAKTAQATAEAAAKKAAEAQAAAESAAKAAAEAQATAEADAAAQKKIADAALAAQKTAETAAETAKAAQKEAEEALAAAEKEAAAQKAAAEKATADKEAAEKALAEANEKLAATQAELEAAQTDLAAAQKSLDKANADLKATNASVADLEKQLAAAEEKIAALEDGAEADELLQKEIADLKEKLEAAKTAKTAAEEAQAAAEADAKTAQANAEKAAAAQKKAEEAQATAEAAKAKAEKELEELKASLVKTTIKIGDVDSDGTVDTKDAMLFTRYYNGDESVTIDLRAADLDRDGEVTLRDVMILTRYVNGWEGYDTYIVDAEI